MRTNEMNLALERSISPTRLKKYFGRTENNLDEALTLYERNTAMAEAMYSPLQGVEICLRNSIDIQMRKTYDPDWTTNGKPPLLQAALNDIAEVVTELPNATHDDIIAELKFAFWVGLLGPKYDASIWRNAVYKAFTAKTGKKRSDVHGRMNAIRRFRNRVAHHEPIFNNIEQIHEEILEAVGWMCSHTHAWVAATSRLKAVVDAFKANDEALKDGTPIPAIAVIADPELQIPDALDNSTKHPVTGQKE